MAGELPLDDGRYLIRNGPSETVLVTETEGALPPARRRRRRPRKSTRTEAPVTVAITVATVILAAEPFENASNAESWLGRVSDPDYTGEILAEAARTLDRVRAAEAAAAGTPFGTPTSLDQLLAARIGYGEGEQVASGRFLEAFDVDARGGTGDRKRERAGRTGSTARTAAILAGRDPAAACEVLVPRVRLDLEAGNLAAARLMIAVAVSATISELEFAVDDEGHETDLNRLTELLPALEEIAAGDLEAEPGPDELETVEEAVGLAERVLRRRRILDQ